MPFPTAFAAHTRKGPGFGPALRGGERTLWVSLEAIARDQDWAANA